MHSESPDKFRVEHNEGKRRFEVVIDGRTAMAEYQLVKDRIIFTHTEVPEPLEGNGLGARLAKAGLEYAREQNLKVMPLCPYIAGYISQHPEYQPLLMPGFKVKHK